MGVIDDLAAADIPEVFADLAEQGLCDLVHIVYLGWTANQYGGKDKGDLNRTLTPVPCRMEQKLSSRQDEGGVWSSYTKLTALLPLYHAGERLEIKLSDRLKRLETATKPETIFEIKTLSEADAYWELVVEEDVRDGQRVEGR